MRNLKVGKKILLGFGVASILLVTVVAVVFFTNRKTIVDLTYLGNDAELQIMNNEFQTYYWEARVEAVLLLTSLDKNAYGRTSQSITNANAVLNRMIANVENDEVMSRFVGNVLEIREDLRIWQSAVDVLEQSNRSVEKAADICREKQLELREASSAAYYNQQNIWQTETVDGISVEDMLRRSGRLDETVVFIRDIESLISTGEYMFSSRDTSETASFIEEMDRIIDVVQENGDVARYQGTKDAAYYMVAVLNDYKTAFAEFERINKQNKTDIGKAQDAAIASLRGADTLSLALADSVHYFASETIVSNQAALYRVVVVTIIALAASVFLSIYISGLISKPLTTLTAFMEKASSTGDLIFDETDLAQIDEMSKARDETGRMISACTAFINRVTDISRVLEIIAQGDLTPDVSLLSDKDTMGHSLEKMIDELNGMFHKINATTDQVATGSRQIANGAQALAQGSTQQASAIEYLSLSISEIADKTNQNAGIANEAAKLSDTIRSSAETGSAHMDSMMQAVQDISEASSNISKVIKVIDDIAFQTNILALNAAVEAARAGQHGKGFAVVAEEVRNLAAKSADAAKDTGLLIENSIEKADLGLGIATDTAESLKMIVDGINRSADIIIQIARLSEEQSEEIKLINTGIEQVAHVVSQNNATAQESAAASQEMNSHSDMLAQDISHFRLKASNSLPLLSNKTSNSSFKTITEKATDLVYTGN
ncbi:MAG: methyl-accepting chemotaxis protein [Oscillospiraceae bacterium]|nr:methyl-accepting chemotaxis protein [Oscillospiraceae bacterium]